MNLWCRKCGGTDGLRQRFKAMYCVHCRKPRQCRDCGLYASDKPFPRQGKRCLECRTRWHYANALQRAQKLKPKPKRSEEAARGNRHHLAWIRTLPCLISNHECDGLRVQAHHVRRDTDGGTGLRPSDKWAVPLCVFHHFNGDTLNTSWVRFEAKYQIDLRAEAIRLAALSPFICSPVDTPDDGLSLHTPNRETVTHGGSESEATDGGRGQSETAGNPQFIAQRA